MIAILMSAKSAAPDPLETKAFQKKDNELITFTHDFAKKILSRDSNLMFIWPKFDFSSISMRFNNFNFARILLEEPIFLRGDLGSSLIIWD